MKASSPVPSHQVWDDPTSYVREVEGAEYPPLKRWFEFEFTELLDLVSRTAARNRTTVIDVGSGTGRTLLDLYKQVYLAQGQRNLSWMFGADTSYPMRTYSEKRLASEMGQSNFERLVRIFDIDVAKKDQWDTALAKMTWPYVRSSKVAYCMLNTLGVFPSEGIRETVIRNMATLPSMDSEEGGALLISVFSETAFTTYSKDLYLNVPHVVGATDAEINNGAYKAALEKGLDISSHTLRYRPTGYVSHWSGRKEVLTMIERAVRDTPFKWSTPAVSPSDAKRKEAASADPEPLGFVITLETFQD